MAKTVKITVALSENPKYLRFMALNPASQIISLLGGERAVSRITGASYTAPYRWQYPSDRGGTGGRIPQKHIPALMRAAKDRGVDLKIEDFFGDFSENPEEAAK